MASVLRVVQEPDDTLATGDLALRRCQTCGEEYPSDYLVCPRDASPLGLDPEAEDPLLGTVLAGTYRIVRHLGRGGMGRLYEAQHARLDRRFAVKVLHEGHSRNRDASARFEREARVLSRIRSDHVLDVIDVLRTVDGRSAIVTARLDGEDLKARLDRVGKLSPAEAVPIARQVCRGLAAAHAQGVVHRDLKPSNLFLETGADGRVTVKILDFGVAKLEGEPELTRTGAVVGTPAYMAPEQARGSAHVDERADLYAVGAVLYRMLTGRPPYSGDEPAVVLGSLLHEAPRRPRSIEPAIPIGLEAVIQRAMARDVEARPADALDLERELAAFDESGESPSASTPWEPASGTEVSTLVLPRGSVARAQAISKRAGRARPIAVVLAGLASVAFAAVVAMLAVGLSTLDGLARTPVQVSASWLLAGAALVGAITLAVRWLGARWTALPEVLAANRTLGAALVATTASVGGVELVSRAHHALHGLSEGAHGWALIGRAALAIAVALTAASWTTRASRPS
jgi:serine/threonine-protein kinase